MAPEQSFGGSGEDEARLSSAPPPTALWLESPLARLAYIW